jgi:hypothetical protein
MTDEKLKNFELYFRIVNVKADTREYRQDSELFAPDGVLLMCVLLPRENEYVYNLSEISLKELSGEEAPSPILTPKGFVYVKKALEAGFETPKLEVTEDEWTETEKKLEPAKAEPKSDWVDPDWGNTVDKNKVNAETWDDEKEKWE